MQGLGACLGTVVRGWRSVQGWGAGEGEASILAESASQVSAP